MMVSCFWFFFNTNEIPSISSQRASVASYSYVPSSQILVALMMESLRSSETSVLTSSTRRNIPEDAILHSHLRGNLKSYMTNILFTLSFKYTEYTFSKMI
jgi:hypothetical protein